MFSFIVMVLWSVVDFPFSMCVVLSMFRFFMSGFSSGDIRI